MLTGSFNTGRSQVLQCLSNSCALNTAYVLLNMQYAFSAFICTRATISLGSWVEVHADQLLLMAAGAAQPLADQDATGSSQPSQQALHTLLVEAEARTASAPRLLVQSLSIAPVHLLVDVHAAGGSRHIPITVDTHRWAMPLIRAHVEHHARLSALRCLGSGIRLRDLDPHMSPDTVIDSGIHNSPVLGSV